MTIEELYEWLETCPTNEWAAVEGVDGEVAVYFPVTGEALTNNEED